MLCVQGASWGASITNTPKQEDCALLSTEDSLLGTDLVCLCYSYTIYTKVFIMSMMYAASMWADCQDFYQNT